jgi:hypothetical protein
MVPLIGAYRFDTVRWAFHTGMVEDDTGYTSAVQLGERATFRRLRTPLCSG